jgi:hypothetical protein
MLVQLFLFFFLHIYLSNTEPLISLGCPLNVVFHVLRGPMPQDAEHLCFRFCKFFTYLYFALWECMVQGGHATLYIL